MLLFYCRIHSILCLSDFFYELSSLLLVHFKLMCEPGALTSAFNSPCLQNPISEALLSFLSVKICCCVQCSSCTALLVLASARAQPCSWHHGLMQCEAEWRKSVGLTTRIRATAVFGSVLRSFRTACHYRSTQLKGGAVPGFTAFCHTGRSVTCFCTQNHRAGG